MKRTIIHTSAAIALLLGIAACTQDEAGFLPEGAEGTPIVFTATGLNPAATAIANTRSTVDGDWEGVQSVAVLMDGTQLYTTQRLVHCVLRRLLTGGL